MGDPLEKWHVVRGLGEGGQGLTYLVHPQGQKPLPDKNFAVLKMLKIDGQRAYLERARAEIQACTQIEHPNVLRILDHDLDGEKPYIVSEYCSGGTLSENRALFSDGHDYMQVLDLFAKICRGVTAAHAVHIVHRDLKPENIFIHPKHGPVVGDFGICYIIDGERFTLTAEVAGTKRYMAPEMEHGGPSTEITPAADVYSLGKILYWMIRGRVFGREAHRTSGFDFSSEAKDSAVHLVYKIFDETIVEEPGNRLPMAGNLTNRVIEVMRLIQDNAHCIGQDIPQPCTYCGVGLYERIVDPFYDRNTATDVRNFGIEPVGNSTWMIQRCTHCGHVALFRLDSRTNSIMKNWKK